MLVARDSRHHRRGRQADILDRLSSLLRWLVAIASGRYHRAPKRSRHRHGSSAFHGRDYARHETTGRRVWLVKQQISAWRLGALVCAFLVVLWLAWCIVAQTAALSLVQSHPDAALSFIADQPVALNRLAQRELLNPDSNLDAARQWAQRTLHANPLNARAFTLLGLIAERKGNQKSAEALVRISAALTWHDPTAQLWLFDRAVRQANYPDALLHLDALLRDFGSRAEFFPTLAAFTAYPAAFKALIALLATSPPWRDWLLSELSSRLANQARLIELYSALSETENPPTKQELRPYLNRLINDGNLEQAYQAWHQILPPDQRARETYPFNRDFDLPIGDLPFNWWLETTAGADMQIVAAGDGGGKRALLVQFSGARVHFAMKQLMLLPAGDYSFTGRVKTEQLVTSRGLWWRIGCANGSQTLANTELVSGTMPWTEFKVDFQVPVTGCEAQGLQLELPARIDPELQIEGQVWYQNLQIMPITKTAAPLH